MATAPDPEAGPEAVLLLTPMTIRPGTSVKIRSPTNFALYAGNSTPILLSAETSVTLQSTEWLYALPTLPLTDQFVRGWASLPDELKNRILACNLTSPDGVPGPYRQETRPLFWETKPPEIREWFYAHLRMGPEIAALSREVYYSGNIFNLASTHDEIK
ncbi:hypothetical protein BDV95DRAFT_603108 [Massariosphaeria phaeospora]|uniref:Uncharacterized protein n=1 Tax=Massariosphaeria phaeospora TaxID=100035 RepID=A0A7C8MEG7_9PLEO|nr:hypothetical protein BDV95DRAFT_603108 [Massariosphaeria phaeospora]